MSVECDIGDLVRLSVVFQDGAGAAADPTTVVCKVKSPAGVVTTYTYGADAVLARDSVGAYHLDWPVTEEWIHCYRFVGTGVVQAAEEDRFSVRASQFP